MRPRTGARRSPVTGTRVDAFSHFVEAQSDRYPSALAELRAGQKRTHWMWFVFPQLAELGHSPTAKRFGLDDIEEARAYLAHPVLGPRLREAAAALLPHAGRGALAVLGSPDDRKLRSCMTLFTAAGDDPVFQQVLAAFYEGKPDPATLRLL